jgi:hypothetical protein
MVTSITSPNSSFPTSARHFVRNGDTEGFTNVAACVTIDGHGYDARNSQPCHKGFYNSKDAYDLCKQCPYGYTTMGVGMGVNQSSCGIAPGFGFVASVGAVVPCPIGEFLRPLTMCCC